MANEDVLTFENNKFQVQNLTVSTAQKHMFQEILTNAVDRLIYTNDISRISVQIQDNLISIENNGDTMLIQKYRDTDDYIPTLFAQKEFCSTNYDNSNRLTGGLNGIGMKAVNFNSNLFIIECDDTISNFSQQFNQGEA
jgi:DNA gyrase/topoisomerase IV subunit B